MQFRSDVLRKVANSNSQTDRQTDRQTNKQRLSHILLGTDNYCLNDYKIKRYRKGILPQLGNVRFLAKSHCVVFVLCQLLQIGCVQFLC